MRENLKYDDKELLLQVAGGNQLAFEQLVRRFSEKVFFHVLTFAKIWPLSEEITQDIFLKIWQKRSSLVDVENFNSYLFVLTKNHVLAVLRKKLHEYEPAGKTLGASAESPALRYEKKELALLLERAIEHLPEQKKQVFRLIHFEGLTQLEVGQRLGIATRTVRWNLISATNCIRSFFHKHCSEDFLFVFLFSVIS